MRFPGASDDGHETSTKSGVNMMLLFQMSDGESLWLD